MNFPRTIRRVVCGLACLGAMFAFQRPFRQFPGVEYFTFQLTPDWQEKTEFVFARLMFPPGPLNGIGRLFVLAITVILARGESSSTEVAPFVRSTRRILPQLP